VDLVIDNGTVVTMDGQRRVWPEGQVVIRAGRIVHAGPASRRPRGGPRRTIDASGCAVLPGLIHGHLHACQTLARNAADGHELLEWLRERIWPLEAAHDRESMRASADLTWLELIRSGATAALDMGSVRHYEAVFESARDAGFRLVGGKCMMDAGQGVPAGLRESTQGSLDESLRLLRAWHGAAAGRLRYAFAPRFVLSCTEELLTQVVALARQHGVRVHTHASESASECDVVREKTGLDNVAYFAKLGLLGPQTTLAHCVWLTAEEQRLLRESRTPVCHCPSANLKLASGLAKVPELLEAGVPVALGADGAGCNNNLDLFLELRLAALVHTPRCGPLAMAPMRVLEMATLHGARALGLHEEVGSLEEGKRADVTIVDLTAAHATPGARDVAGTLVHACRSSDVRDVIVDGEVLMRQRRLRTLDEARVLAEARRAAGRLRETLDLE
jgi:5-methylthioadenosine/S-adenosylhomocysteine deaminase